MLRRLFLLNRESVAVLLCHLFGLSVLGQTEADVAAKVRQIRSAACSKDGEGRIVGISMISSTDEQIESIDFSVLSRLNAVSISSRKMTNRSLVHLRRIPAGQLEVLRLVDAPIDDQGLVPLLQRHKSLRWITLKRTKIGDGTLAEIGKLKDLGILWLDDTKITDAGLKSLTNLPRLHVLHLPDTAVSDVGLREIKKLSELDTLFLSGTKITDAGIEELAGLDNLLYLDVSNTRMTDAGILKLGTLNNLQTLNVSGTKVTEDGKKALQRLLPDLKFEE